MELECHVWVLITAHSNPLDYTYSFFGTLHPVYTWNPNDRCFDWKRPCFGGLTFKIRGHLSSRHPSNFSDLKGDLGPQKVAFGSEIGPLISGNLAW